MLGSLEVGMFVFKRDFGDVVMVTELKPSMEVVGVW